MCLHRALPGPRRNMDDFKKKLTRSLSGPRRCSNCQKMVYFSIIKCKQCGDVTHKHCSHHTSHRCNSSTHGTPENSYTIHADSEVWCSIENPREWWLAQHKKMSGSSVSCDFEEPHQEELRHHSAPSPGAAMAGLLKIVRWLSHRRRASELNCKTNPNASEKHVKGRFGLNPKLEDKEMRKRFKALIKNTQNYHRQMYGGVYYGQTQPQFSQQRCSSAKTLSANAGARRLCRSAALQNGPQMTPSPRSSVSSCTESPSPGDTPLHDGCHWGSSYTTSNQLVMRSKVSPHVEQQLPNDTTTNCSTQHQVLNEVQNQSNITFQPVLLPEGAGWTASNQTGSVAFGHHQFNQRSHFAARTTTLKFTRPLITKAKTLSIESRDFSNESLCATWPPVGKAGTIMEDILDENECSDDGDEGISMRSDCPSGEETLREWCIPFGDLEFKERLRHGRQGDIYRGRWYGEVLIYTMRHSTEGEAEGEALSQFLDEVTQMGLIRHENIVLFMGACIEPPRLAVVTSMRKGPTLYEYLHLKRHRLPFHSKLNIARQIAQGMGYLHAKGIAHRRLNSKNIILESRVKLCIMDHGMADKNLDRSNCGCIPRGQLSYISPELMTTLQIDPPRIRPICLYTQQSDIYAFGSLLFELLAERFAFHDQHPHSIIWQVASGKRCSLHNFRFINGLKCLIRKCWSQNPEHRPPFSEIVTVLQENVSHHKRHSSSEPEKLHYTGQSLCRNICT